MKTIFANPHHLSVSGPNASFGNHILHLMFCLNLSCHRGFNLKIPVDSNLDLLFDLEEFKSEMPSDTQIFFSEKFSNDLSIYRSMDLKNLINSLSLLKDQNIQNFPDNFAVEGWFYNAPLYPSINIFNKLKIKESIKNQVFDKYKDIFSENSISLHYRGTDFQHYYKSLAGDIRLTVDYYLKCLDHLSNNFSWIRNVNIFTEDCSFLFNIEIFRSKFPKLNFQSIKNDFFIDWLCLFYSKNIICSNSSFCSSSSAYNKMVVYQPNKYMLVNTNFDFSFPTSPFFNNSIII